MCVCVQKGKREKIKEGVVHTCSDVRGNFEKKERRKERKKDEEWQFTVK